MKIVFILSLLFLAVGIPSNADTPPHYRLIILPLMFGTGSEFNGGINARGQVVGTIIVKHSRGQDERTALWQAGHSITILDRMGGIYPSGETLQETVYPTGINARGNVIGEWNYVANGAYIDQLSTACIFQHGDVQRIGAKMPVHEDTDNFANGINDRGTIVGSYVYHDDVIPQIDHPLPPEASISHAYLLRHGHSRALWAGDATAINNQGWIVGTLDPALDQKHPAAGVLWRNGRTMRLAMQPEAINEHGEIAGTVRIDNHLPIYDYDKKACVWRQGRVIHLSQKISDALALNNHEQIVGYLGDPDAAPTRAVLWQHGYVYDLNRRTTLPKNYVLTDAIGINDHGWIIGRGTISGPPKAKGTSTTFTYLLIPR